MSELIEPLIKKYPTSAKWAVVLGFALAVGSLVGFFGYFLLYGENKPLFRILFTLITLGLGVALFFISMPAVFINKRLHDQGQKTYGLNRFGKSKPDDSYWFNQIINTLYAGCGLYLLLISYAIWINDFSFVPLIGGKTQV